MSDLPAPPKLSQTMTDLPRALWESYQLCWRFQSLQRQVPVGNGKPVICISGYGGTDSSMYPLRKFLEKAGYQAYSSDIGINLEGSENRIKSVDDALLFRQRMVELLRQRVDQVFAETGQPVSLIGWSMGGLFAVDLAQIEADKIAQVISLGAPFGDPRGTATFKLMRWLSRSDVAIEDQDFQGWLDKTVLTSHVPITVIYSDQDGIVSESAAMLADNEHVRHIKADSSHIGFAFNPEVYRLIAGVL